MIWAVAERQALLQTTPVSLVCPICSASYNIPAAVLGANGRKVSCKKCGHVWHAMPPDAARPGIDDIVSAMNMAPAEPAVRESPAPKPAPESRDRPPTIDFETPQLRVIPPAGMRGDAKPEPEADRTRRAIAPRPVAKPEHAFVVFFRQFFPIVSLFFLAVIFTVLMMAREEIVRKAPGLLSIYHLVSISPLPPGGGISIVNVRDQSRFGAMDNDLVLSGELVNHTSTALHVPLFKMIFTSTTGQSKTFMARSPVETIEAGASVPFNLERAGFAQEGWNVKLTFGDGTEGPDTGKPIQTTEQQKSGEH